MPGRRASQQRAEERVKNDKATKETGGSQQKSKGRAQGRGHRKNTGSATPQQSTREGHTRGTGEGQHPAPWHAPHRHHTHRTHPHLHPRHAASGPRKPAQGAGSREERAPEPKRPPPPPLRAAPHWACRPRGRCRAPVPAHPRPQHVGSGPRHPPRGRAAGGVGAPDPRRSSQWWKAPPPGTPFRNPHGAQCWPARARAVRPVLGPHAHTNRTRDTRVAEPWPPAREDGRPGEGQRLTPDAPHSGGRPPPPGDGPYPPPRHATPTGHAGQEDSAGPPHPHTRAHGMWVTDPNSTPRGRAVGGGGAPDHRRPSQRRKAPPPGDARPPPTASNASAQGRTLWGRGWVPTHAPTAPGTHGSRNPGCPLQRTGGWGRDSA